MNFGLGGHGFLKRRAHVQARRVLNTLHSLARHKLAAAAAALPSVLQLGRSQLLGIVILGGLKARES